MEDNQIPATEAPSTPNDKVVSAKSKTTLIIGVLLLVLVVGGGSYFMGTRNAKTNSLPQDYPKNTLSPTIAAQKISPAQDKKVSTLNFQSYLNNNCKRINTETNGYSYGMSIGNLPIVYDTAVYKVKLHDNNTVSCGFFEPGKNNGFLTLNNNNYEDINIYDKNSIELGHGGYPYLSLPGKIVENKNNIKLSVLFSGFSEGGDTIVDDIFVRVRGEREFTTTNGSVFVNFETTAIPKGDPRLMNLLSKNSAPSDQEPGKRKFTGDSPDKEIVRSFFSDLNNLQSPEKEKVDFVRKFLESIKLK